MEMPKRRALGKGLEDLFSTEILDFDALEEKIVSETPKDEIIHISIDELRANPYQPRKVFDENALNELADSIREYGVFQPIIVKKSIKGYEIVAGERRVRASKIAGVATIPAIIRDFDDSKMMEIALLENLQRENLNAIEEASAYVKIMENKGLSHAQFAQIIGKNQSYVTNLVGLLKLPENIQSMVIKGDISMTHARALSKMTDPDKILELANRVINEGLTTKELEELASDKSIEKRLPHDRKIKEESREYKYIEEIMCEKLDTKVRVYKNRIEIKYSDIDNLNKILDILNIGK